MKSTTKILWELLHDLFLCIFKNKIYDDIDNVCEKEEIRLAPIKTSMRFRIIFGFS